MRWFVGDTETTDNTDNARVCEIAWAELDENTLEVIERQHSLIDPLVHISAAASGVHGIVDGDVGFAPTITEFFSVVYGKQLTGPSVLIAHNAGFDYRFFAPFMPNAAGMMCTLRLSRRYLTEAENHQLATLKYQFLGAPKNRSHSADGDVETTVDLVRLLVKRSGLGLSGLMAESLKPVFIKKWPFGKHRDKPLDVDKGYCRWALGNMKELDSDLRWSIEQVMAGVPIPA